MSKITPGDDKNIVQNWDSKHLENFTTLCENEIFFSFKFMIPEPPVCYLSLSKIVSDTFGHFSTVLTVSLTFYILVSKMR